MTGQVEHHKATRRTNVARLSWPTGLSLLSPVSRPRRLSVYALVFGLSVYALVFANTFISVT